MQGSPAAGSPPEKSLFLFQNAKNATGVENVTVNRCTTRQDVKTPAAAFPLSSSASLKSVLPDRESNPGLPRDRRRSSPLDYRGISEGFLSFSILSISNPRGAGEHMVRRS